MTTFTQTHFQNTLPSAVKIDHLHPQLYIVFVVADGGIDLEHFELRTLAEAKSILFQVLP